MAGGLGGLQRKELAPVCQLEGCRWDARLGGCRFLEVVCVCFAPTAEANLFWSQNRLEGQDVFVGMVVTTACSVILRVPSYDDFSTLKGFP